MQSDKIFVHNRVGLLDAMNYGHSTATEGAGLVVQPSLSRLPSPTTDSEEDKGYKSWAITKENGSDGGPSPPLSARQSESEVFMPPPSISAVLNRSQVYGKPTTVAVTPASKIGREVLVTSTPNVPIVSKKQMMKKNIANKFDSVNDSLNWQSEEDEVRFSQQSSRADGPGVCCDKELCECQSQLKFSFAINCEDGDSVTCSSSNDDVETVSSQNDMPFDEDEKVLSGDRLSQMTRTYHDIEAVTHLLEEKERDLELAARIGQTLLQKNKDISQRNELLEEQLAGALEEVSQLRHEISLKEDLLHTYADDDTDSSGAPSPVKELRNFGRSGMYHHIESLQAKIKKLEDVNGELKLDQAKYQTESETLESQEHKLVSDTFRELETLREELRDARQNNRMLSEELSLRNDEAIRQQEEITRLLTQIVDMQRKQKQLALENEELQQHLTAANATQYELTREIHALEDRYQEVATMLDETREEARLLRDCPGQYGRSVPFSDSLAAELECSGVLSAEMHLQDSNPLSFSATPINWSSPPSSVVDGESEESGPHAAGRHINRIIQSEPRPRSNLSDSLSQRVLRTARFVNNVKNYSMNSRFQYATPKKQDRPIPTPLPIPGSNRSPLFIPASPDGGSSSGRCMSSTPHDKCRSGSFSTSNHSRTPLKYFSHNQTPKYASLRLQLASKTIAKAKCAISLLNDSPLACKPVDTCPFTPSQPPVPHHNRSMSALIRSDEEIDGRRAERTWHGESLNGFARHNGLATPSLGRPGIPGTEDLERAIRKLALRRENAKYMEMQNRLSANDESFNALCSSGDATPSSMPSGGCTPPPSGPGSPKPQRRHRFTARTTVVPKLRIVKSLEGSVTLNQWKYLAERDLTFPALQAKSDMPSGIITREVLSKSREGSLNNTCVADAAVSSSHMTPIRPSRTKISDSPISSILSPPQAASSPPPSPKSRTHDGKQSLNSETLIKEMLQISPIRPGKGFALTSTRNTFINSRVMNPSDDSGTKPLCTQMVQSTVYCNTNTSTHPATSATSNTGGLKSKDTLAYLSTIHPFISGQPKPAEKTKREKAAESFFQDSTRTCSMQLGLAQLFQEHGVKGLPKDDSVESAVATPENDADLDSPPLIGSGANSAFTSKVPHSRSSRGHIVWNRCLQRTFLLPSTLPSRNIFFNLNRRSESKKPDTPPNSPVTDVPSSSPFLLNEILPETPKPTEAGPKKEDESIFSSNLVSKLTQIGWMGLQGLSGTSRMSATTCVSSASACTSAHGTSSTLVTASVMSPRGSMARCATAPGSLRATDDTDIDSVKNLSRFSSNQRTRPLETPSADGGVELRPTQTDWAELHGSSGALNFRGDARGRNDVKVRDGYLDQDSSENESEDVREPATSSKKADLRLSLGKTESSICKNRTSNSSTRPKTRPKKK